MNASVNIERNSWRLPPDETVQVADPRSKSAQVKEVNRSADLTKWSLSLSSISRIVRTGLNACRCTVDGSRYRYRLLIRNYFKKSCLR